MRILPRWLALLSLVFFASCHREQKRVIAVIPKGRAHLFWQSVHAGAAKAGLEKGVSILWNRPAIEADYTGHVQIVDPMINLRVDAVVVGPLDRPADARPELR